MVVPDSHYVRDECGEDCLPRPSAYSLVEVIPYVLFAGMLLLSVKGSCRLGITTAFYDCFLTR
jgi:hypothetical protein